MKPSIGRVFHVATTLLFTTIVVLLIVSITGCSAVPSEAAQTALKVILGESPVVYARKTEVKGYAEFWCVIVGGPKVYTLASTQILEDFDGGWNASMYQDHTKWEQDCGPVPSEYANSLR